jgi:hypothetical protein
MTTFREKLPYELSREEFNHFSELHHPDGMPKSKYNGKKDYQLMKRLDILQWLGFGVQKWLYQKALSGDKEALYKIEFHYDLYEEVINKAKEEGKI